jgi:hypothetical protein
MDGAVVVGGPSNFSVASQQEAIWAATCDFYGRGWSLLPMRAAEKRPARRWKRYQKERASWSTIRRWFKAGKYGVGVIFGTVSANLVSRDFDAIEAYDAWAALHPELAEQLPTVVTPRGRHVYARAHPQDLQELRRRVGKPSGTGAIAATGGELRCGVGCYSVLPPSIHHSGHAYRWAIPLPPKELPEVDLLTCGFVDLQVVQPGNREDRENTGEQRELRITEAIGGGEGVRDADATIEVAVAIEAAIQGTLPRGQGRRHKQVFELARALKAIPALHDADASLLRGYVERWHRLALTHINTKPFDETWADFVMGWPKVKFPVGSEPMSQLLAAAEARGPAPGAREYETATINKLVGLCRELQRVAGDEPFFLSCRTAGKLLKVSPVTVCRHFAVLKADRVVAEVEKGDIRSNRASRYRYQLFV